jgi:sodium/bile acid cotransporter 7
MAALLSGACVRSTRSSTGPAASRRSPVAVCPPRNCGPSPSPTVALRAQALGSSRLAAMTAGTHGVTRRHRVAPCVASASSAVVFTRDQLRGNAPPSPLVALLATLRLPVLLVIALIVGSLAPEAGQAVHAAGGVPAATSLVFLLTGLGLRRTDVRDALTRPLPVLYGILATLVLAPCLGIPLLELGPYLADTVPPEFLAGLAAMLCMPTTLSTGVILTQQVGGNAALALLLLIATNVLGVFTLPYAIQTVFGYAGAASVDPLPLVHSLAHTMLAPLFVGIAVRAVIPGMWRLLDAARPVSRLLQQACLVATPWMSISVYADQLGEMDASALVAAVAAAAALHIILLLFNTVVASVLRLGGSLPRPAARVRRPVILATSQKTLPVCVAVLDQLGGALGAPGLVVLPCVAYHLLQILIDSALVAFWLKQDADRA